MQSLWMLFASFVFSVMGVCVKLASETYSIAEIITYRGLVGVVFMYALIRWQGGTLRTALPWHHAWRGAVGVTALWMWFYSISELPIATGMTLNYMAPIWIAAILFTGGWLRRETGFEWGLAATILVSFVGVTLLLRPAFHADQWFAALIGLMSGILSALAYLQVRKLGLLGEPEYRVVFYFSATGFLAGLVGTTTGFGMPAGASGWHAHTGSGLALLLAIGITATVAQVAMTRAYRLGKPLLTANLQYSGILFSSLWGVLIWSDVLSWQSWAGMVVILGSGMAATWFGARRALVAARRRARQAPADGVAKPAGEG
ncbi:MAG TPA: DMT family transporter [Noviherbaspirillum sp.]|nr:DMT family transporter [Noviherbaspirillum sp.]